MKKIITTALALVLTLGMSVTAFAAPSPSTTVTGGEGTLADGTVVKAEINKLADTAVKTEATEKAKELVSAESQVVEAVEVKLPAAISKENPATIGFKISSVAAGTDLVALHKLADGTWETLPCTWKDGKVYVTFTSLSPVVFVSKPAAKVAEENNYSPEYYESLKAEQAAGEAAAAGVTSPKTADAGVAGLAFAALICGAGIVCVNRKKVA